MKLTKTNKSLTVNIIIDNPSKFCLNKNGEIRYFDNDLLLSEFSFLKEAKKKGVFNIYFTSITAKQHNEIIKMQNKNINRLINKTGLAISGGLVTMLKNKGF